MTATKTATTYTIQTATKTFKLGALVEKTTIYTVVDQDGESWGGTGDKATAEARRDYLQRCADAMVEQDAA